MFMFFEEQSKTSEKKNPTPGPSPFLSLSRSPVVNEISQRIDIKASTLLRAPCLHQKSMPARSDDTVCLMTERPKTVIRTDNYRGTWCGLELEPKQELFLVQSSFC